MSTGRALQRHWWRPAAACLVVLVGLPVAWAVRGRWPGEGGWTELLGPLALMALSLGWLANGIGWLRALRRDPAAPGPRLWAGWPALIVTCAAITAGFLAFKLIG